MRNYKLFKKYHVSVSYGNQFDFPLNKYYYDYS